MNKNILTNIVAVGIVIITAMDTYLTGLCADCEINFVTLIVGVVGAIATYFIGKKAGGE